MAADGSGNVYIAESGANRVRKVAANGVITTVAGSGVAGYSGDGGAASGALLNYPLGVAVDGAGNLYILDSQNEVIRRVSNGVITTIAGSGVAGFTGDGGAATSAALALANPGTRDSYVGAGIAVDAAGAVYFMENFNNRVRKVAGGVITTVAGNGTRGYRGDGGAASGAQIDGRGGIALDSAGNLYIADGGNNVIRKVVNEIITTIAGDGTGVFGGDGGGPTSAQVTGPLGVAVDASGNIYVADTVNQRIRKITAGVITTIAGTGAVGAAGDGGLASNATFRGPVGLAIDGSGNIYVADTGNNRVRVLLPIHCDYTLDLGGQAFPSLGGSGVLHLTTLPSCTWSISGLPAWITLTSAASGKGNATITYQVTANSGGGQAGTLRIGGTTFNVEQQSGTVVGLDFKGSLAHIVSAGTWETLLNYINLGTTTALVRTNLFGDSGSGLALPLDFPQSPTSGTLLASSLDRTLAPGGSLLMHSAGPDAQPTSSGWSNIFSDGNVSGFAIFTNSFYHWNAIVPLETRTAPSYLLPFDNTGNVVTGLAIANLSPRSASVPVILRDESGTQIDSQSIALSALGHDSFMLADRYPAVKGKRGTVEFDTPASGRISVLGLRATGIQAVTTVPVLANITPGGGSMAHVAIDSGWDTTFTVVNTGSTSGQFKLDFYDNNGGPLILPLRLLPGALTVTVASITLTVPGNGSVVLQTLGNDALPDFREGSAVLTTTAAISAHANFRWNTYQQEATVPLETRTPGSFVMAFDNTGGLLTGLAVAEVGGTAVNVAVNIRDDNGVLIDTPSISLAAHGHAAFLLGDRFTRTVGKRGTVEFIATGSGKLSVLGLRAKNDGTLTTIPALAK